MNGSWRENENLLDLLIKRATEGLSEPEAAELAQRLREYPDVSMEELDEAVTAILLGAIPVEPMPAELAARIVASAPVQLRSLPQSSNVITMPVRKSVIQSAITAWLTAAACLLLAVAGWWPRLVGESAIDNSVAVAPTQARAGLLASGRAIQAAWTPGTDAAATALAGDVVFDPVSQRGYLRFRGIPANDPRLEQYQLWIADANRTQPQPVDGGVFNVNLPQVTPEGDVIIPFQAKLQVGKPAAFVVTVEQPGGVVVSGQERVVALARVQTN